MASGAVAVLGKDGKVIVWVAQNNELTYYHYNDEGFHHTVCLLDSIPDLQMVHTAALQTPKKKESLLLEKFNYTLQYALKEKDDDAAEEEQRPAESLVQSHGSIGPITVQSLQPIVKGILSTESAYLHFCGNVDFQHEPTLCVGLKLLLEQDSITSCDTIGPGTLLQSFLQIDATAADALLMWPPANVAQQFQTGGHASTNSIYGLLASACCTSSGKQLLKRWLRQPLVDAEEIRVRHDTVEYWLEQSVTRDALRLEGLKRMGNTDLRKLATVLATPNLSTRKALMALYDLYLVAWQKLPGVVEHMAAAEHLPELSSALNNTLIKALEQLQPAIQLVEAVLDMDQAPREYLVQIDYKDELKDVHAELQTVQEEIQSCFDAMNEEWGKLSGSANNQVRLEETNDGALQFRLPDTNASKILQQKSHLTVHRILKNGVYFSTTELKELCSQRQELRNEYDRLQAEVVVDAIEVAATYAPVLEDAAQALAAIDVLTALAHTAAHHQYCRPEMFDTEQPVMELVGARHPCVELQEHVDFIPNDCSLGADGAFLLVTGPNMGGKSTYLRSLGSIALLAQIGSFVPCTSAKLNICHHILARIGAGDWQERGISTFMAEMLESSRILKTASCRSLILIDELGRGTSTYDGYGLARAISEYIMNKIGCLTIFATHFHELTSLPGVKNCHVTAQTDNGALTFLYTVRPGPCLQSFGIAVAEMANVPASVIEDAKKRAQVLEKFDVVERFRRLPKEALTKPYASSAEKKQAILSMLTA